MAAEAHQTPTEPSGSPGAQASHPYTHQQQSFYQSPHFSHVQTGSPVQSAGYWSGHFAPSTPEKIDFSKISLRKTSDPRSAMPASPMAHPHSTQASPTAAIWREAMAHPEFHSFASHLSWIQEQPELHHRMQQQQQPPTRPPFRRHPNAPGISSTFTPPTGPHLMSPNHSTSMDC